MSCQTAEHDPIRTAQRRPVYWMKQDKPASVTAQPGASAQAILSEVAACAAHFAATGETAIPCAGHGRCTCRHG